MARSVVEKLALRGEIVFAIEWLADGMADARQRRSRIHFALREVCRPQWKRLGNRFSLGMCVVAEGLAIA